ncbi:hypothetical protein LTR01_001781 [Friedmanniomyces endolithicus]|nr:hypothetical protein LTS09_004644 [Friedmanniomyces endolithicus]KAK0313525.1 hypothetical protein LTR01_001781 [Friedmanniomyces endolithicus]KAK0830315.1 hypothetical protein LTR73_003593 [Friedmanniomyces endolithicus]
MSTLAYTPYENVYRRSHHYADDSNYASRHDRQQDFRAQDDTDALVRHRQRDTYASAPSRRGDNDRDIRRERRDYSAPDPGYYARDERYAPQQHQQQQGPRRRAHSESRDDADTRPRTPSHRQHRHHYHHNDDDDNSPRHHADHGREPKQHYAGDGRARLASAFDVSERGVLAAAAGAGVGAIAVRRFGEKDFEQSGGHDTWKTIGGVLVGGALANAAEKRWARHEADKDGGAERRVQGRGGG